MGAKKRPLIGLEFEIEGLELSFDDLIEEIAFPHHMWSATYDGTLRGNSAEFVSDPIPFDNVMSSLDILNDLLDSDYENSHRCSTHIHIGLCDYTAYQRIALFMLVVSLEDFFFSFDPDRKRNHFCTPLLRSPAYFQSLSTLVSGPNWVSRSPIPAMINDLHLPRLRSANCKYCSVNTMTALSQGIGTLELRHFPPMLNTDDMQSVVDHLELVFSTVASVSKIRSMNGLYAALTKAAGDFPDPSAVMWCVSALQQYSLNRPDPTAGMEADLSDLNL